MALLQVVVHKRTNELHRWLDPATVAPPQRDQFLGQLYMSIVECFVLKGRGEDPNSVLTDSPLDIGWGVSFRKIQLSS